MNTDVEQTCLMEFLLANHPIYHNKILELRKNIEDWLAYVPQSFPHYTRHTIKHSDEIVSQLSKLLFTDDDPAKPVVKLSSAEVYILIVAAYLHDAGMVVSDKEKAEILVSDEWKRYISDGNPGAKRWEAIQAFRNGSIPLDEAQRNFLADVQTRFLVAEFIRRIHHLRASEIITQHEVTLGNFTFGDPILKRTINDVCVAHGLRQHQLLDAERFPDRRDIGGETVNVRFLAILLRIGDLLDMSFDRACPLLLNAACPIPADSLAHWTKYQRITHRLIAPDRIELKASCQTQDEHRYLTDWCQWLVDEIKEAGSVMAQTHRHSNWRPPEITIDGDNPTIRIDPDKSATYIPSKWKFQLDSNIVFERFIKDAYDHPLAFVRELLQNALDANRCQLYLELKEQGLTQPDFPTEVDEKYRSRYSVEISLSTKMLQNELSGTKEEYQVLIVEDFGIGMDRNIIENYLLQVGRSYYTTDEFRRTFRFVPTSRFGIGFLSVFAISDNVKIETFKPASQAHDGPLYLTITGPRNYLLIEKGTRNIPGTRITVLLRKPLAPNALTEALLHWCKRVEFPIIIDDLGKKSIIKAERSENIEYEAPLLTKKGTKIRLKAYPIEQYGLEGEIYILSVSNRSGERWDMRYWLENKYPSLHPAASKPQIPESILCVNGITVWATRYSGKGDCIFRMDYRKKMDELPISRSIWYYAIREQQIPEVDSCLENALRLHLEESRIANSANGWKYKNRLIDAFPLHSFWSSCPNMLKVYRKKKAVLTSFEEIYSERIITLLVDPEYVMNKSLIKSTRIDAGRAKRPSANNLSIRYNDLSYADRDFVDEIFQNRRICYLGFLSDGVLAIDWMKLDDKEDFYAKYGELSPNLFEFRNAKLIGLNVGGRIDRTLLNLNNSIVNWLIRIKAAGERGEYGLSPDQFKKTFGLVEDAVKYYPLEHRDACIQYLNQWQDIKSMPPELRPPSTNIQQEMIVDIDIVHKPRRQRR
jgi:molecular chaperone HtpG